MRARYYNPEIKRFINQDVLTGSITDSPTLNRYAYVEGNPISLADPFGLSPAINWRGAGHTILGLLGFLTFVPGLNWVGIAANAINAVWYFSEGNIFEGLCSTVGVFGGGYLMLGKAGTASCGVINFFKYTTATLSVVVGVSDMHTIAKKNYDAALHGEGLTLKSFINDTVRVVFDSTSIAGGIKLAAEPTPWCFVGETLIAYENGQKRIDEIEVGDKVWAYDIETGKTELKEVQIVYVHDCDEILHLHTSCEDIDTTTNHPFYVIGKGWVTAGELETGDEVYRLDGSTAVVTGSELERLDEPVKVYNLEVEDYHTYFVGDYAVLVHNYDEPSPALDDSPYNPEAVEGRVKPPYKPNPQHDSHSNTFKPDKTPEPLDAASVYDNSYRANLHTWYGKGKEGIYRFFHNNIEGSGSAVHFSGVIDGSELQNIPKWIRKILGIK